MLIPQSRYAGYIHGPRFLTPSREDSRIYISPVLYNPAGLHFPGHSGSGSEPSSPSNPPQVPSSFWGLPPFSSSTPELGPPVTEPSLSPDLAPVTQSPLLWPSTPSQRNPGFYPPTLALTQCALLQAAASHLTCLGSGNAGTFLTHPCSLQKPRSGRA